MNKKIKCLPNFPVRQTEKLKTIISTTNPLNKTYETAPPLRRPAIAAMITRANSSHHVIFFLVSLIACLVN